MLLHDPISYVAHRDRRLEHLEFIASLVHITVEQLISGFDYKPNERIDDMARGRKPGPTQAEQLLAAINFVSVASGDEFEYSEFVSLAGNMAVCYNGQLAAGYPITEELSVSPHLDKLKVALNRCGKTLVLAETPNGSLSVKGDKLRAVVPCYDPTMTRPIMLPDPNIAVIDDRIKEAFKVCGTLATEAAIDVLCASLLLEANQCTGTNRMVMLQFWHGIDLPPGMVLPKVFTAAIAKAAMKLIGFGFTWSTDLNSPSAVTMWFENGAWLKTQCYNDRWPVSNVVDLFSAPMFPVVTPSGLFEAIEATMHFNDAREVWLVENAVQSDPNPEIGAQYDVPGLQGGKCFDGELVGQVAPFAMQIDLTTHVDRAYFVGGEAATPIRGALMAKGPKSQS